MATKTSSYIQKKLALVARQIGNTPVIPIRRLHGNEKVKIYAKAEWNQLSGSIKARAAFGIIRHAITEGVLDTSRTLLDATSGNTGIAYAAIGKELGIRVTLCLPENASAERKNLLNTLGAEIIYTSKFGGTDEAQEIAKELALQHPDRYFYADQYSNTQNWQAHYDGTAEEIIRQVPDISHFVAGLGTTGTFTGTSKKLKEIQPEIQAISLQPDLPLHGLEGWKHLKTAVVPGIYDPKIADRNIEINTSRAYDMIREVYLSEAILLSPSSAANIAGAVQVAHETESGTIVTVLPDNAGRYGDIIRKFL